MPLQKAVEKLGAKSPVGAALRTKEWAKVPLALRERAQFSAGVESARFLQGVQDRLAQALQVAKKEVAPGKEAYMDRSVFIGEMRKLAMQEGLSAGTGSMANLQDVASQRRLGLIFDMQTQQAQEYSRWKTDQDPAILNAYPAQKLIRVENRRKTRPWQDRWAAAGNAVGWEGAIKTPMVALKTSPIWVELSRFQTPWPPFDFGSGMGLQDIPRKQAISLGLLSEAQEVEPSEAAFNDSLQASVTDVGAELLSKLVNWFGDKVTLNAGKLSWRPA